MNTIRESNSSFIRSFMLLGALAAATGCGGSDEVSASSDSGTDGGTASDTAGTGDSGATSDTASSVDAPAPDVLAPDVLATDVGSPSSPASVNLGTAGSFAVLAKTGVSTVPASAITGNVGLSPAAATYLTGFSLIADATNVFATSPQVTGKLFASNYAVPTPANLTTAIGDMMIAFTDAASRAPKATELGAGNIGGMTLTAGVYKWGTGLLIPSNLTLQGSSTDVFVFQIAQNLTVSNGVKVSLAGGAVPKNVFWQIGGFAEIGTTAHLEGVVLAQTAINLRTGASINGRLFAQTAVMLDSSTVVAP